MLNTGDTAFMIFCSAMVLFMTMPGLALFYAGMVRKKNILSVLMQNYAIVALVSVLWATMGYTLAFSDGNGFLGGFSNAFFRGVESGVHENAKTIPHALFATFQMTFAIISCAIITGSLVERIKFSSLMVFVALFLLLIYTPTAHWVWHSSGWLAHHGVLDYAGGTVVHINAGVAGLVGALMLGKRLGYKKEAMPPHNLVLTLVGVAILWFGWFGFNAGSALGANQTAALSMLMTQISTAVGAVVWVVLEILHKHKPSSLGFASGAVCGLVAITPAAGFVSAGGAIMMSVLTCAVCFYSVTWLKHKLGYDDSLDAFGIHGIGGVVGGVLTGVFYDANLVKANLLVQVEGVVITLVYSGVVSFLIFWVLRKTLGLRVTKDEEREGLDHASHGERVG